MRQILSAFLRFFIMAASMLGLAVSAFGQRFLNFAIGYAIH